MIVSEQSEKERLARVEDARENDFDGQKIKKQRNMSEQSEKEFLAWVDNTRESDDEGRQIRKQKEVRIAELSKKYTEDDWHIQTALKCATQVINCFPVGDTTRYLEERAKFNYDDFRQKWESNRKRINQSNPKEMPGADVQNVDDIVSQTFNIAETATVQTGKMVPPDKYAVSSTNLTVNLTVKDKNILSEAKKKNILLSKITAGEAGEGTNKMEFFVTNLYHATVELLHARDQDTGGCTGTPSHSVEIKLDDVICTEHHLKGKYLETHVITQIVKEMSIDMSSAYDDKIGSLICVTLPAAQPKLDQVACQTVTVAGYAAATSKDKGKLICDALDAACLVRSQNGLCQDNNVAAFITDRTVHSNLVMGGGCSMRTGELESQVNGFKLAVINRLNKTSLPKLLGVVLPKSAVACLTSLEPKTIVARNTKRDGWDFIVYADFGVGVLKTSGVVFITSD